MKIVKIRQRKSGSENQTEGRGQPVFPGMEKQSKRKRKTAMRNETVNLFSLQAEIKPAYFQGE